MNKNILIFAAVLSLPLAAVAGAGGEGCYTAPVHNLERLSTELQLSAEQKSKMDVIFKEQHEKFRAYHDEANAKVKEVLTAEQMSKWEQMQQQCQERHRQRMEKQGGKQQP